jgi:phosphonate transport system substrate-binding protein
VLRQLRMATFLAPNVYPAYKFIAEYVGEKLDLQVDLIVGSSFDQFERGEADFGFICGLPYVELADRDPAPVELVAAPVLQGERFQGRPVYFSDVIVRSDSPYRSFEDLSGCRWSFNDRDSQSGYGITRYWLASRGENQSYFGQIVEAGFHQESIRLVCEGVVDASAIDCQVLAVEMRENPELASQLKLLDALGPSSIQPVVAASHLPDELKAGLRKVFLEMGEDPVTKAPLAYGFIKCFAPVEDSSYDDIRQMKAMADSAGIYF